MNSPLIDTLVKPQVDRFLCKFVMGDGCWEWTAGKSKPGYGRYIVEGQNKLAHRVSYEMFVGAIPEDKVLDHLCRNKSCVRPSHLEPVDFVENVRRGTAWSPENIVRLHACRDAIPKKTHCPQGHPYEGANLYVYRGFRSCVICQKATSRRAYLRKKARN